jgi:tetratricopeptide (TPR) repeat protein
MKIFPQTNRFYCLLITLLILLVYSNSFNNSFQYDDYHVIVKNPAIKDPANYIRFLLNPQLGSGTFRETSGYRPLLIVSFALNYTLGGLDVFGYHLVNFFLHTLCALLVFYITLSFLGLSPAAEELGPTRNQLTALFAALLFALHPVQTESVTYITGRSNLMTALFYLLAFWAYLQYQITGKIRQSIIHGGRDAHEASKSPFVSPLGKVGWGRFEGIFWVILSLFSYACALLTKETAVCLIPTLILFHLLFPLGQRWKRWLFSLFPYLCLTAAYLIVRVHFFGTLQYNEGNIRPLYDNVLTQFRAWVHYLGTLLLPFNLNVDYDFRISHSIFESRVIFSILVLIILAVVIWRISKASRMAVFFASWFVLNLLPTNSLIPLEDVVTDRWLYLPAVGYAVILAMAAEWLFRVKVRPSSRTGKLVFVFFCALLLEFYGFATVLRNFTWTSYWTLWEDAVTKSPNKARPHTALGLAFTSVGRIEEAIGEFKKAIQLNPMAGGAYLNLGYIYNKQGRFEEAIQAYKKAMVVTPRLAAECHNNLGNAYLDQGRKQEAINEFRLALRERPGYARPYFKLGGIYEEDGNIDQAIACLEKAARTEPEFVPIHQALMRLYEKKGWAQKAREARENFHKFDLLGRHVFFGG